MFYPLLSPYVPLQNDRPVWLLQMIPRLEVIPKLEKRGMAWSLVC